MRISVNEARTYFLDPSQQLFGITSDNLPEDGVEYWACGPVCGVFHLAPWPDVWMAHYGMKPEWRGFYTEPARKVLRAFWDAKAPARIIGWTEERNRLAVAFARRLGFERDGEMNLPSGKIIMQGWAV